MPGVNDSPSLRIEAGRLLGVPPETLPAEARAVFLKRLEGANFVPSEQWCAGAVLLGDIPGAGGFRCAEMVSDQVRRDACIAAVDRFREEFWYLHPTERSERLKSLRDLCRGDLALTKQLQMLARGIDLQTTAFNAVDGRVKEIADLIKETFVMRPVDAAARQFEWLARVSSPLPHVWMEAVRLLRANLPRVAELDAPLLDRVRIEVSRGLTDLPRPVSLIRSNDVNKSNTAKKDSTSAFIYVGGLAFVSVGLVLMGLSLSKSDRVAPPSEPPPRKDSNRGTRPATINQNKDDLSLYSPDGQKTFGELTAEIHEKLLQCGNDSEKIREVVDSYLNPKKSNDKRKPAQKQEGDRNENVFAPPSGGRP